MEVSIIAARFLASFRARLVIPGFSTPGNHKTGAGAGNWKSPKFSQLGILDVQVLRMPNTPPFICDLLKREKTAAKAGKTLFSWHARQSVRGSIGTRP